MPIADNTISRVCIVRNRQTYYFLKVNSEKIRNLQELEDGELFELQLAKGNITLDLPIQLCYFIL